MNLIVTDKCTNSCPYCFASIEMSKTKNKNILEKENIDVFIDFLTKESGNLSLNIIGGEPFIYPHIDYLMDKLCSLEQIKHLVLFTGGVINEKSITNILKYRSKISLLFNLNEKSSYLNPRHHEIVIKNIEQAIDNGIKTSIGYNIYKIDFNGKEIIDYCNEYGVKDMRFAVANSIYNDSSSFIVPPEKYELISPKVFTFLKQCFKNGIKAHLDCTLPFCFFTDKQMGEIAKMHPNIIERFGKCGVPIDINYDLTTFRCFPFSSNYTKKLTDFDSIDEIIEYYKNSIDTRLNTPYTFENCKKCKYRFKCNGGCLSNNKNFLKLENKEKIMVDIFNKIESGSYKEAQYMFKQFSSTNAADKLIEMHLQYKLGHEKKAIIIGREAINIAKSPEIGDEIVQLLTSIKANKDA